MNRRDLIKNAGLAALLTGAALRGAASSGGGAGAGIARWHA